MSPGFGRKTHEGEAVGSDGSPAAPDEAGEAEAETKFGAHERYPNSDPGIIANPEITPTASLDHNTRNANSDSTNDARTAETTEMGPGGLGYPIIPPIDYVPDAHPPVAVFAEKKPWFGTGYHGVYFVGWPRVERISVLAPHSAELGMYILGSLATSCFLYKLIPAPFPLEEGKGILKRGSLTPSQYGCCCRSGSGAIGADALYPASRAKRVDEGRRCGGNGPWPSLRGLRARHRPPSKGDRRIGGASRSCHRR